jgi:hypothetical protein
MFPEEEEEEETMHVETTSFWALSLVTKFLRFCIQAPHLLISNFNPLKIKLKANGLKLSYNSCSPLYNTYSAKTLENSFSFGFV